MYRILCDGYTIYDPRIPRYSVAEAKLKMKLSKADALTLTVFPDHPNFSALKKLKSDFVVYSDGDIISRGRILDEKVGWNNEVKFVCEGAFAFLNDTIQRPFSFPADANHATPADYFSFLVGRHNAQESTPRQITIGRCTVTDPNNYIERSDTQYSTTYKLLKEGLLDTLGGYLFMSYTENGATLEYLDDFSVMANQPIEFGRNLLSLNTDKKGDSIVTAILPLGTKNEETGERLTLSSLPDSDWDDVHKSGDIVFSSTAESVYGARIVKVVTFDDITVAANLLTRAREYLAQAILAPQTVSLTAADLSAAGYDYNAFALGTYVRITDKPHEQAHGLATMYLVSELSIDLLNPANNKLTLGATTASLIDGQKAELAHGMHVVEVGVTEEAARRIRELEERASSAILQSAEAIRSEVSESVYTKGEVDGLVSEVGTSLTQTAQAFRMEFTELHQDVDDVLAGVDAEFSELYAYISFAGGAITLGKSGSEITLKIENDRIGIYRNGVLITYWTADKQLTPATLEIPVGGRMVLGEYAFIPRTNGSLDFTWIGA